MVKITPSAPANRGKGTIGSQHPRESGTTLSKSIGWLNKEGILQQPIIYSQVIEPLSALGDYAAGQLLGELSEKAWSIKDPTGWLTKAAANALSGVGGGKGSRKGSSWSGGASWKGGASWDSDYSGGGYYMEASPWVSKAIGRLNKSGKLKEQITWSDTIGVLSAIPEGVAIGLIKELETKAEEINKPTGWLLSAASRYASGSGKRGISSSLSKQVGVLNKSGKLSDVVSWNEVSGPLLLMEESDAEALISQLEEKAEEIKNPTNWLRSAAEKSFKKPKP